MTDTPLNINDRYVSLSPTAGSTALAYDFELRGEEDLTVIRIRDGEDETLAVGDDYSFPAGTGDRSGGTIELALPSLAGDEYRLIGLERVERLSGFAPQQKFSAEKFNGDLDAQVRISQELRRDVDRSWKADYGQAGKRLEALDEGHFWKADADGNMVDGGSGADIADAQGHAAQVAADKEIVLAARDDVIGLVSSVTPTLATVAIATDIYRPPAFPSFINIAYFDTNQVPGSRHMRRLREVIEADGPGDIVVTAADETTQARYAIHETAIDPAMLGARYGASSSQHAALQAALDLGVADIVISGVLRIESDVTCDHDIKLRGPGTLDFRSGAELTIAGSAELIPDLAANVARRARSLTLGDASAVNDLDWLCLYNPTDYSWSGHRYYYREGEFLQVHSKSGDTLNIFGRTFDAYTAADMDVYKINGVKVDIDEIRILPSSTETPGIRIDFGIGVTLGSGIRAQGGLYAVIELWRCMEISAIGLALTNNSPVVGDEYGFSVANCHDFRALGCHTSATRHAFALTGWSGPCCVPTRLGRINSCILASRDSNGGAADAHGCADDVTYESCHISDAAIFGGRDMKWLNNTIHGAAFTAGCCMYGSEIIGGLYEVRGNKLISEGDGNASAYVNILAFGPSATPTGLEGLRENFTFIADDNTFDVAGGASAQAFRVYSQSSVHKANAQIGRTTVLRATQMLTILDARNQISGDMNSDFLIVDGPIVAPAGTSLMRPHASIANVPTRQMRQRIRETISCASGSRTVANGANTLFRYPYSKMPDCLGVVHGSTAGGAKVQWGGQYLAVHSLARASTGARHGATGIDGNFSSTEDVLVVGLYGIEEI